MPHSNGRRFVLAAAVAALAAGCGNAPPTARLGSTGVQPAADQPLPTQPAAMRPLAASAHLYTSETSQGGEPGVRVLRDAAAWEGAWRELHAGLAAGPAPAVDFGREMVVVVAAGERPSGGHALRVDATSTAPDGALVLHVTATAPGEGCMSTAVITSPVDVVRVPRTAGAVRADTRTVRQRC
jgi:hypothetical protein